MYNSIETNKLYLCLYHTRNFYSNQSEYISYSQKMPSMYILSHSNKSCIINYSSKTVFNPVNDADVYAYVFRFLLAVENEQILERY
jgi:hypothetical protein